MTIKEIVEAIYEEDMGARKASRFKLECFVEYFKNKISFDEYMLEIAKIECGE